MEKFIFLSIHKIKKYNIIEYQLEASIQQLKMNTRTIYESQQKSNSQFSQSGTASSELKYKKAVKQISRLISINTSMKKQLSQWQQNYKKIEQEYEALLSKYQQAVAKNIQIERQRDSQGFINKKDKENIRKGVSMEPGQSRSKFEKKDTLRSNTDSPSKNSGSQQQLTGDRQMRLLQKYMKQLSQIQQQVHQKQQTIAQLHLALEKKHLKIIQLEGKYGDLTEEVSKYKNNNQKNVNHQFDSSHISIKVSEQLMKQKKRVEQLQSQLKKTEQWAKQIQLQYQQLRKQTFLPSASTNATANKIYDNISNQIPALNKLIMTEGELQYLRKQSISHINKSSSITNINTHKKLNKPDYPLTNILHPLVNIQIKKYIQQCIQKQRSQYQQKKYKYKQFISKLKQENDQLNKRNTSMFNLLNKQQQYIQTYISKSSSETLEKQSIGVGRMEISFLQNVPIISSKNQNRIY